MNIVTSTEHVGIQWGDIFFILDTIKAAGYKVVDFNFNNYCYPGLKFGDTEFFSDDWKDWIKRIAKHCKALDISFVQSHNLIFNYFENTDESNLMNKMVDRAIEACGMLGIKETVVHPVAPPNGVRNIPACLEMNAQYLRHCVEIGKKHGVQICSENMMSTRNVDGSEYWRYCDNPADLIQLVDAVTDVTICFDAGHAHYMGEDIYETMLAYGDRISALHIHDNDQSSDQHLAMYSGTLDWNAFMRAFVKIKYAGNFTLETFQSVNRMPMELKVGMLREIREISEYMLKQIEALRK